MRRTTLALLAALVGISLLLIGIFLLMPPAVSFAQAEETAPREYVGAGECGDCHGDLERNHENTAHALALFDVSRNEEAVLADFSTGADVRTVQFPNETEARPFTADDVKYVIGSGRYLQRFVYEADENVYWLLPAQWNTHSQAWEAYTLAETWGAPEYNFVENCAGCHVTGLERETASWEDSGVQCEACHGAGSFHVETIDDIGRVSSSRDRERLEASINIGLDSQTCGQCHSQGNSGDSPYPTDYVHGGTLADGYTLVSPDDSAYWLAGHASQANMQFNEWLLSGHAESFSNLQDNENFQAACLECHNNTYQRAVTALLTIESDIDDDDMREKLEILFEDANLEVDDIYRAEWDELQTNILTALELDNTLIQADVPFLPQVLPYLLARLQEENNLEDSAVLPQSLAAVFAAAGNAPDEHSPWLSVSCASCHNPHQTENPTLLRAEPYALCISCHQSAPTSAGLHHPVKEMYEGLAFVAEVAPIAGAHFSAENAPTCTTCHMPSIPVENETRASHTMSPLLPRDTVDIEALQDVCSACHSEIVDARGLQSLIDSVQTSTSQRLETLRAAVTADSPAWLINALDAVEGDGSKGFHNYAYANSLLKAVETELGLSPAVAELEIFTVPTPQVTTPTTTSPAVAAPESSILGLNLRAWIFLGICGAIVAVGFYAFFIKGDD